jgi:phosphatidylserine/phosphatidylglycerophosphate/cardiolipin synthase-like enzyme
MRVRTKDTVARPLAKALVHRGWTAWLDELELTVGDSLSRRIDEALSQSQFGVVVLSPYFFQKQWTQRELAGLAAREIDSGAKVILPVWHRVTREDIVRHSPTLADRVGARTADGIEVVADHLSTALEKTTGTKIVKARAQLPFSGVVSTQDSPASIGRNSPCWCGSGKKYKKCHGDLGLA